MPALAAIAAVTWARPAAADELRLVVLLTPAQQPWLPRLEGQLADLDVAVEAVVGPAPISAAAALTIATGALRSRRAAAVAWLVADDGGWWVHVAVADGHRLLVRRVDARAEGLSESAASESAAMIVRTAMRSLASGQEVGEVVAEPPPPPPIAISPRPTPSTRVRPRTRPWGQLAWRQSIDEPGLGHAGVEVRLGVARGPWRAALVGAYQPSATITEPLATIAVSRATGGALIGLDLWRRARWRLAVELEAGVTRFDRTTVAATAPLSPTAGRATWSVVVTPSGRLRWRVAGRAWLTAGAGLDLMARPPRFSAMTSDGAVAVAAPWPVAPRVDLGLIVELE